MMVTKCIKSSYIINILLTFKTTARLLDFFQFFFFKFNALPNMHLFSSNVYFQKYKLKKSEFYCSLFQKKTNNKFTLTFPKEFCRNLKQAFTLKTSRPNFTYNSNTRLCTIRTFYLISLHACSNFFPSI
jgi:hypothetical protein